jgi:anti-sigma-K factor RskA
MRLWRLTALVIWNMGCVTAGDVAQTPAKQQQAQPLVLKLVQQQ